jgi:hypothetical protein
VFPLHSIEDGQCTCGRRDCTDAGKHPRVARGLKDATRDLSKIDEWFGKKAPLSNIAIVTGELSGITVIDIDIGDGKFGAESWAEAIKEHGEPDTLKAETGSGGAHAVFQYNSALKTAANVLGKGVDCRNDGGYIVAAPSLHRSGGVYKWIDWDKKPAVLPAHLSRRKETRGRPRKDDPYRGKYTIEQIESMLEHVPADDRDLWRNVGIILGREFDRVEQAWEVYTTWADTFEGKKGRNHDAIMHQCFYELSVQGAEKQLTFGTIVKAAIDHGWAPKNGEVPISQFIYYGPGNNYIYRPTTSLWVSAAVDAAVSPVNENSKIVKASVWLKRNQLATSMTCDPTVEMDYLKGYDCLNGEIVVTPGSAMFNSYRRPTIELGDGKLAQPFLNHVIRMFPHKGDAEQFLNYMAHRVQKPWEKPRFALLISGGQGVGKDTAVEFCGPAIGAWNFANIDPAALESGFNEYAAATLVRINEAANLHEMTKWAFNEKTKVLIAGSPDICQINPKYGQKYSVRMYCGVILTTNHLAEGIYIPKDDRRYDVIQCATLEEMELGEENARREYFTDLWNWFLQDGASHVAAYLNEKDIKDFSAANGQRKTDAHATIVAGGMSGDEWLDDILDEMGNPAAVRSDWITAKAIAAGEKDGNVRRKMANAMGRLGYTMLRSHTADGRWKIGKKKVVVYAKPGLPETFDPIKELAKEPF